MEGWVKLHRQIMDKAFYSNDSEKVHLWIHLLLKANHSGREEQFNGKPIHCRAGQFTIGRKQLSKETGINESKIQRILSNFEKIEQQIEQQTSSSNRLITVLNWDKYQGSEQRNEQQVNNNRTTSEQQVNNNRTHYNNDNNNKNDNNEKESVADFLKNNFPSRFDKWKMDNSSKSHVFDTILKYFDNVIELEDIPKDQNKLFARLNQLTMNWKDDCKNGNSSDSRTIVKSSKDLYND